MIVVVTITITVVIMAVVIFDIVALSYLFCPDGVKLDKQRITLSSAAVVALSMNKGPQQQ